MRESGSNAKGILAYLRKRTEEKKCLRDVHNMLQTIRSDKRGDTSDATHAEYVLCDFFFSRGRELGDCVCRSRHSEGTCCCVSVCSDEEAVPCVSGSSVGGHNTRYQLK
ncbi:hypothetical protein JG687_00001061 [Phytophthora cactorum]|uniref:Uncharacterized protein n=1 Tax=Phytophthora cactorum TaxID=29920 RepID=A0A8T1V320_9STRA|nr:hypothetical protein JG687_00001061 [Phytophthora cactorum]